MNNLTQTARSTILPSRSRYQLRNFVIGQHDTKPMQWRQVLLEAQQLAYNIAMAELDIKRKEIEIQRLHATGDELDAIDAEEKRLGIAFTQRVLAGARLELSWLEEFAHEIGEYTLDQIEANQSDYWKLRLQRQAGIDQMAAQQGIGAANLQSMLSAGLLQKEEQCAISSGS